MRPAGPGRMETVRMAERQGINEKVGRSLNADSWTQGREERVTQEEIKMAQLLSEAESAVSSLMGHAELWRKQEEIGYRTDKKTGLAI